MACGREVHLRGLGLDEQDGRKATGEVGMEVVRQEVVGDSHLLDG
jgi:hypothetical protein